MEKLAICTQKCLNRHSMIYTQVDSRYIKVPNSLKIQTTGSNHHKKHTLSPPAPILIVCSQTKYSLFSNCSQVFLPIYFPDEW